MTTPPPRIHVLSETIYNFKGNGVHTAFLDSVDLLKQQPDVEVIINGEGRGDVLHAHTYGPYFYWKGWRYRGRRILTVHVIPESMRGTFLPMTLLMPLVRLYFRLVYSYADVCIAISPAVEETIRSLKVKTRIVRIVNPVNTRKFAPAPERRDADRRRLGLRDDDFVVLTAGQIHKRKGIEDFLAIAESCPELKFIWAGSPPFGSMTESFRALQKRINGLGPYVKFIGAVEHDDMPSIYNAADLFLFPSRQENCPLAPLEAASAGLPVIFRDLPEYAKLYENPYWKAKDVPEFIELVKKTASDPEFRKQGQMISRGLLPQFEAKTVREKLLELYQEVIRNAAMKEKPKLGVETRRVT